MVMCNSCDKEIPNDAIFCSYCGKKVEKSDLIEIYERGTLFWFLLGLLAGDHKSYNTLIKSVKKNPELREIIYMIEEKRDDLREFLCNKLEGFKELLEKEEAKKIK